MREITAVRVGQLNTSVDVDGAVEEHPLSIPIVFDVDGVEMQERSVLQSYVGSHVFSKKETPFNV